MEFYLKTSSGYREAFTPGKVLPEDNKKAP